jgi:hypothetical protein
VRLKIRTVQIVTDHTNPDGAFYVAKSEALQNNDMFDNDQGLEAMLDSMMTDIDTQIGPPQIQVHPSPRKSTCQGKAADSIAMLRLTKVCHEVSVI